VPESVASLTEEFVREMELLYQERLDKVILFGSYARGEEHGDSDVDYLVVLNDPEIKTFSEISRLSPVTANLGLKYGVWVSAIPMAKLEPGPAASRLNLNVFEEGIIV